jgi:hypothetical protein
VGVTDAPVCERVTPFDSTAPLEDNRINGINQRLSASSSIGGDAIEPARQATVQIGEAAARRHPAPIESMLLWGGFCASAVVALHKLSAAWALREGPYRTGILTLSVFLLALLYPVRKYTLWFSLRFMRLAPRLPHAWAVRLLLVDRLETWRVAHVTLGVFAMLPFWWHTQSGRQSLLELVLEIMVLLLLLSGFFGVLIEDFLPSRMLKAKNQEVRAEDIEAASHALYVQAEELVLGHSEALVHAYLQSVRPILASNQPSHILFWATLTGNNPAAHVCRPARLLAVGFGTEAPVFNELVDIAERKVGLDHNHFNLRLGTEWLRLHYRLAISVLVLIVFHVSGVLYFAGI